MYGKIYDVLHFMKQYIVLNFVCFYNLRWFASDSELLFHITWKKSVNIQDPGFFD